MSEATPKAKKQDTDPDAFMTAAREALQTQREGALAKLQAAQDELDAIDEDRGHVDRQRHRLGRPHAIHVAAAAGGAAQVAAG